jgi:hypothetical protein
VRARLVPPRRRFSRPLQSAGVVLTSTRGSL